MSEVEGTHAHEVPGPFLTEPGEVSYVAAFPGAFVKHPEIENARENAKRFCHLRPVGVYRIELLEIVEGEPAPEPGVG